jgi:hypothetical protein
MRLFTRSARFTHAIVEAQHRSDPPLAVACIFLDSPTETRTIAWQYGLLEPLDWDDDCERELVLQNTLWNALVEIERDYRASVAALLSADDAVSAGERAISAMTERIGTLAAERRARRQTARARLATPEIDAAVAALRDERRQEFVALKEKKAKVREHNREALGALAQRRYQAIAGARRRSGLWWGNYNAVVASFDVALRALGPGEDVHFHRYDGSGRITNQLQGGIRADVLLQSGHTQLRIVALDSGCGLLARGAGKKGRLFGLVATVNARGRGNRRTVTWPIVLHRPFPEDAVVKTVTITRRRLGPTRWRWRAAFVCEVPAVPKRSRNGVCGIDTGWRKLEGGLRVATLCGAAGEVDHVILPQRWLDRREGATRVAAAADAVLNALLPCLLRVDDVPEDLAELWVRALPRDPRPRSGPLAELARRWRRQHRGWRAELREDLTVWLHHRIEYADLVDKLSAWRREIYRVAAKAIAERFAIVAVDRIAMQVLARDKEMPREVRKLRGWAAPYDLAAEIRRAVAAVGGRFLEVGGATTRTCHRCGHHNVGRTDARRSDLIWQCEKCLALWDQDVNAARNVLAAASGKTALVASASRARKTRLFPRARLTRKGNVRKPDDNPLDNRAD